MKRDAVKFLESVWLSQPQGEYACIAWKVGDLWRQRFIHRDAIERSWQNRGRDLYFCPNLFSEPRRTNACACPSKWLYADLDEVDPREIESPLEPDLWWETSPGRYQALWELEEPLSKNSHAKLNQRLTYYLNADRNGWPASKVLRVPGSVSTKWGSPWRIELGEAKRLRVGARAIWEVVRDTEVPNFHPEGGVTIRPTKGVKRTIRSLERETQALLRRRHVRDRSAHVFLLARLLMEQDIDPDRAAAILVTSPVAQDKYGGRLEHEVERVVAKAATATPKPAKKASKKGVREESNSNGKLPIESLNRLLAREIKPPGWLVGGIWSDEAHGMIAGEEKTYKSLLAQDLAVSVASGTPFLNHFPVPPEKVGPVIYAQEENKVGMVQDRFLKICLSRKLNGSIRVGDRQMKIQGPQDIPLHVLNNYQLNLTLEDHIQMLAKQVEEKKAKLLVLDPFYLMTPGVDENSAAEVVPVLRDLLRIKQQLNCGILIIHHYKKQDRANPFHAETARISGTGAFGRWYESLLLVEKGDEDMQIKLYAKHREAPPDSPVVVNLKMGDMGDYYYDPEVVETRAVVREEYEDLKRMVEAEPGVTVAALAMRFGMRTERMKRKIERSTHFYLERTGNNSPLVYLRRTEGGKSNGRSRRRDR